LVGSTGQNAPIAAAGPSADRSRRHVPRVGAVEPGRRRREARALVPFVSAASTDGRARPRRSIPARLGTAQEHGVLVERCQPAIVGRPSDTARQAAVAAGEDGLSSSLRVKARRRRTSIRARPTGIPRVARNIIVNWTGLVERHCALAPTGWRDAFNLGQDDRLAPRRGLRGRGLGASCSDAPRRPSSRGARRGNGDYLGVGPVGGRQPSKHDAVRHRARGVFGVGRPFFIEICLRQGRLPPWVAIAASTAFERGGSGIRRPVRAGVGAVIRRFEPIQLWG